MAASTNGIPSSCFCLANSTIRIAFLHARPTSTIRPICVKMLLSLPLSHTPTMANKQAHRHDEDDRERQPEAFVLRRQHEKDEQDAERINIDRRVAGEDSLDRSVRSIRTSCPWEDYRCEFRHQRLGLAGTEARRRAAVDLRRGITVVTHRAVGAVRFLHRAPARRAAPFGPRHCASSVA